MGVLSSKQAGEDPWKDPKQQRQMLRHVQESLREVAKQDGFFDCSKMRLQVRTDREALTKFESDCIETEVGDGFPGGWVEGAPLCSAPLLALQRSCVYLCDVLCENERLSGTSEDGGESHSKLRVFPPVLRRAAVGRLQPRDAMCLSPPQRALLTKGVRQGVARNMHLSHQVAGRLADWVARRAERLMRIDNLLLVPRDGDVGSSRLLVPGPGSPVSCLTIALTLNECEYCNVSVLFAYCDKKNQAYREATGREVDLFREVYFSGDTRRLVLHLDAVQVRDVVLSTGLLGGRGKKRGGGEQEEEEVEDEWEAKRRHL